MLNLTSLFISPAFAQDASPSLFGGSSSSLMSFLPLILIFGVFWVLVIRPQQKKLDEQTKMLKGLQRGDRVVTSGGIHGKITRTEGDDILYVEIADGVQVKMDRSFVSNLAAKTQPANDAGADEDKSK